MNKIVSISLNEAQEWKLTQLQKKTGISKSSLMRRALMFLIAELDSYQFPGGAIGQDVTEEDLWQEYSQREK